MGSSSEQPHSRLPKATSTTRYWRRQPHALDEFCSSETVLSIIDVAVIGGSLSGACTAYYLLAGTEASPTAAPSIVIFEAQQACSGATGRNGGHSKLAPVEIFKSASKYGPAAPLEFALFIGELMHLEMKACADNITITSRADDEQPQNRSDKTLAEEFELLVIRSCDVFLDEYYADDAEKEWFKYVSGM